MVQKLFLTISLFGAEWVLYLLILLSILSITLIIERFRFYREATAGLLEFRSQLRRAAASGNFADAKRIAEARLTAQVRGTADLESGAAAAMLGQGKQNSEVLAEVGTDAILRNRVEWERNLAVLATIGTNAPFVGLFGTVLGIIKAFHDLSQQAGTGAANVTAGISEALIATAVGILVAIPATVAFNLYQRRVRSALTEADALKSYLIGVLSGGKG